MQWPDGWPRTPAHERIDSRFGKGIYKIGLSIARDGLLLELERLGAANIVITTDLPTRRDGLPYADSRASDVGVAVWFAMPNIVTGRVDERVFACDKWRTHAENMRAIALSIEAMRGLARWGAGDVVNRAFTGFAALPPGSPSPAPPPKKRPWWEVLGINAAVRAATPNELLADIVKIQHRKLIKNAHPDAGGSHELAAEINAALAEAERELGEP